MLGLRRAYKHSDSPSEEAIQSAIASAIWCEIDEKFDFEGEEE